LSGKSVECHCCGSVVDKLRERVFFFFLGWGNQRPFLIDFHGGTTCRRMGTLLAYKGLGDCCFDGRHSRGGQSGHGGSSGVVTRPETADRFKINF